MVQRSHLITQMITKSSTIQPRTMIKIYQHRHNAKLLKLKPSFYAISAGYSMYQGTQHVRTTRSTQPRHMKLVLYVQEEYDENSYQSLSFHTHETVTSFCAKNKRRQTQ